MDCDHVVMSLEHYEELKKKVEDAEKIKKALVTYKYVSKTDDYAYIQADLTCIAESLNEGIPEGFELRDDIKEQTFWLKKIVPEVDPEETTEPEIEDIEDEVVEEGELVDVSEQQD